MTPEGKVKLKVKKLLKDAGAYQHWPVQTGYGTPCLDCHACIYGWYVGIETKAPGKKPTVRQEKTIGEINAAQGITLVIDGDTTELENLIKELANDYLHRNAQGLSKRSD
jgi:hypothetical protein